MAKYTKKPTDKEIEEVEKEMRKRSIRMRKAVNPQRGYGC